PLEDVLLAALLELKRLKAHEAIRRQKQFIGKLMRHANETAILDALNPLRNPALQRQLELLLARLLEQGDAMLAEVMQRYPAADRHTLRQLVRQARKEADTLADTAVSETSHPARHKLWIYLRELAALAS
ncbi:MAG: ribosome biogenesis factor YjgA, partial [Perlucidibaca sp.]